MFINNNPRFCSLCIWKVSVLKIKTKNCVDEELTSESDTHTDSDTNNDNEEKF